VAFKILFTEESLGDLKLILDFISVENPAAAEHLGIALLNHIELLSAFPHIGTPISQNAVVRKVLHTPVRIYYRIDEARKSVEILHFWHTARQQPEEF
jgi:plasmid stabilization system protein ParE